MGYLMAILLLRYGEVVGNSVYRIYGLSGVVSAPATPYKGERCVSKEVSPRALQMSYTGFFSSPQMRINPFVSRFLWPFDAAPLSQF